MRTSLRRFWTTGLVLSAALLGACDDDPNTPDPLLAPSGLTAAAVTSTSAALTFGAVSGADGYVVERALGAAGAFAEVAEITGTTYVDEDLDPETEYRYRVAATREDETSPFSNVLTVTTSDRPTVVINADITASRTLRSDTVYVLTSYVHVTNGATLTIEPGTLIQGTQTSALFILRGAQINAQGTADAPIVFTSSREAGDRKPGDWGGLIILGNAQISRTPVGEGVRLEGTGTSDANYPLFYSGGTAAGDTESSGTLRYVRVEFAGFAPVQDAELNSVTLAAVGSGTTVEYVQVLAGLDDGFEWFGGTVDAKHLVSYETGDDHFDASEGFRGRVQYMIALQDTVLQPRTGSGGLSSDPQGIENDGCAGSDCAQGFDSTPLTTPMFANFTLVGTGQPAGSGGIGMLLRRGVGGFYVNGIVARWSTAAISIRDQDTFDRFAENNLVLRNVVLAENGAAFQSGSGRFSIDEAANQIVTSNAATTALFTSFPAGVPTTATLDWTPAAGSAAATAGTGAFAAGGPLATKGGTFVTGTAYAGAAAPNGPKWWQGWTSYARN